MLDKLDKNREKDVAIENAIGSLQLARFLNGTAYKHSAVG
jgi:hypothetical protein